MRRIRYRNAAGTLRDAVVTSYDGRTCADAVGVVAEHELEAAAIVA